MTRRTTVVLICLMIGAMIAAGYPANTAADSPTLGLAQATPTPEPSPTPESPSMPSAVTEALTAAEIFSQISPSVVFIDTPAGTGSGVLTEGGYIVTNAHVVWPFETVRVVFPDGSEYPDAPLLNWDLLADLAVIGPLDTVAEPLLLADGEALPIGADVFLIGYPGEVERFPQPTVTRGILSRVREWEPFDLTYFQVDAAITGGQSGGVLVSEQGDIIGISGLVFSQAEFGLVTSAADVLARIERLIAGEDVGGLGERRLVLENGTRTPDVTLQHSLDAQAFVFNGVMGADVKITADGEKDVALLISDLFGLITMADDHTSGTETGSVTVRIEAPHFVELFQFTEGPGEYQVTSSQDLFPYDDPDDGLSLALNQSIVANIDHPVDLDYFILELEAGDLVRVRADSILVDPYLAIYDAESETELAADDDSGGGLFGLSADLIFEAPDTGPYYVAVNDSEVINAGGYVLQVEPAPSDAIPTVSLPVESSTTIDSPVGPMTLYQSALYPFSIQYPAGWTEPEATIPFCALVTACFVNEEGGLLAIAEEDLTTYGLGTMSPEEYVDTTIGVIEQTVLDFELLSREEIVNPEGLSATVITFNVGGELLKASRLIYLYEDKVGFNATYMASVSSHTELEPVIEYSFNTFSVGGPAEEQSEEQSEALLYLEQGLELLELAEPEAAVEAFTRAIDLAPELAEAYRHRARAYERQGDLAVALADLEEAVDLNPEDPHPVYDRAFIRWLTGDGAAALEDIDRAIELDETSYDAYSMRALIQATQGNYEEALADVASAAELRPSLSGALLDTRAYIHFKNGNYQQARADYEEIFDRGLAFPHAHLGAGLTYAVLGEGDRALPLLQQGLAEVEEAETPDPQLADLILLARAALTVLE